MDKDKDKDKGKDKDKDNDMFLSPCFPSQLSIFIQK